MKEVVFLNKKGMSLIECIISIAIIAILVTALYSAAHVYGKAHSIAKTKLNLLYECQSIAENIRAYKEGKEHQYYDIDISEIISNLISSGETESELNKDSNKYIVYITMNNSIDEIINYTIRVEENKDDGKRVEISCSRPWS